MSKRKILFLNNNKKNIWQKLTLIMDLTIGFVFLLDRGKNNSPISGRIFISQKLKTICNNLRILCCLIDYFERVSFIMVWLISWQFVFPAKKWFHCHKTFVNCTQCLKVKLWFYENFHPKDPLQWTIIEILKHQVDD